METLIPEKKISELTVAEFRELIRETLLELADPDNGLDLREGVLADLKESEEQIRQGKGITIHKIGHRRDIYRLP